MNDTPWWLCDHRDAGLPGCPTGGGRIGPEGRDALRRARDEIARLTDKANRAWKAWAEAHNAANAAVPECRIGGEPPVPMPGWSAEVRGSVRLITCVVRVKGGGFVVDLHPTDTVHAEQVDALWPPGAAYERPVWRRG